MAHEEEGTSSEQACECRGRNWSRAQLGLNNNHNNDNDMHSGLELYNYRRLPSRNVFNFCPEHCENRSSPVTIGSKPIMLSDLTTFKMFILIFLDYFTNN